METFIDHIHRGFITHSSFVVEFMFTSCFNSYQVLHLFTRVHTYVRILYHHYSIYYLHSVLCWMEDLNLQLCTKYADLSFSYSSGFIFHADRFYDTIRVYFNLWEYVFLHIIALDQTWKLPCYFITVFKNQASSRFHFYTLIGFWLYFTLLTGMYCS